eukprot:g7983.t1
MSDRSYVAVHLPSSVTSGEQDDSEQTRPREADMSTAAAGTILQQQRLSCLRLDVQCVHVAVTAFLAVVLLATNIYFIILSKPYLNEEVQVCQHLALWYFILGVVILVTLSLRLAFALVQHSRGHLDSSYFVGPECSSSYSTAVAFMAALINLFVLTWIVFGIVLLGRGEVECETCLQLYWPMYYLFVIFFPAMFLTMCLFSCLIICGSGIRKTAGEH